MSIRRMKVSAEAIKNEIRSRGLKQWWVAEGVGIHRTTLRRWINGEIVSVQENRLQVLSKLLSVEPDRLMQRG